MAVLTAKIKHQGRNGSEDSSGIERENVRYVVQTDTDTDAPELVRSSSLLPVIGAALKPGSHLILESKDAQQDAGNPRVWGVTCRYASRRGGFDDDPAETNPLLQATEYSWFTQDKKVPVEKGILKDPGTGLYVDGMGDPLPSVAITSSAGQPFNPPPEVDESTPVLRVSRNESADSLLVVGQKIIKWKNSINSDVFLGANPGRALMKSVTADFRISFGIAHWRWVYQIAFLENGWDLELLDQGTHFWKLNPADLMGPWQVIQVQDAAGREVTGPVPFNGLGFPANVDQSDPLNPFSDYKYMNYRVKKERNFAELGLL